MESKKGKLKTIYKRMMQQCYVANCIPGYFYQTLLTAYLSTPHAIGEDRYIFTSKEAIGIIKSLYKDKPEPKIKQANKVEYIDTVPAKFFLFEVPMPEITGMLPMLIFNKLITDPEFDWKSGVIINLLKDPIWK